MIALDGLVDRLEQVFIVEGLGKKSTRLPSWRLRSMRYRHGGDENDQDSERGGFAACAGLEAIRAWHRNLGQYTTGYRIPFPAFEKFIVEAKLSVQ
jgi:hypothetical protein